MTSQQGGGQSQQGGQYQGKNIRSQRPARDGDPGFQQGADQVVITLDDGSEKTVKRSEVGSSTNK
jgi:hypothetical protein